MSKPVKYEPDYPILLLIMIVMFGMGWFVRDLQGFTI